MILYFILISGRNMRMVGRVIMENKWMAKNVGIIYNLLDFLIGDEKSLS